MIRWALLVLLAGCATAYAHWLYLRVDLAVPAARRLALVRSAALVVVLALLFDVRLPRGPSEVVPDWVLLDASLSMGAAPDGVEAPWALARERARALEREGYRVARFGGDPPAAPSDVDEPGEVRSLLAPALQGAAEQGARRVVVLSDGRFEDPVGVRAALETLPLDVRFERFESQVANAGIARLDVPDFVRPDEPVTAEVEVHAAAGTDSVTVEIRSEGVLVASTVVAAPEPGLTRTVRLQVPFPVESGPRARLEAVALATGDGFADDDRAVDYALVGRREDALVVVSLRPDWEPRYLLGVLREVTGLPTEGYLRVGPDRFVRAGRALERGTTVDAETVRAAARESVLLAVHGVGSAAEGWVRDVLTGPGPRIVLPYDAEGAALVGVSTEVPLRGEWYASADLPPSPVAGAMVGVVLQGLPPLTDVLVPTDAEGPSTPLLLQLRGAGAPVPSFALVERPEGRLAVALASGFWRWSARDVGRDAYRTLWSGVAGWALEGRTPTTADARPAAWVAERGAPIVWTLPPDSAGARIVVSRGDTVVADTLVSGRGAVATPALEPGPYGYAVVSETGDTLGAGRFDVATAVDEMRPAPTDLGDAARTSVEAAEPSGARVPLRTSPWPYLLVITLLCGEWVGRRRSGLR